MNFTLTFFRNNIFRTCILNVLFFFRRPQFNIKHNNLFEDKNLEITFLKNDFLIPKYYFIGISLCVFSRFLQNITSSKYIFWRKQPHAFLISNREKERVSPIFNLKYFQRFQFVFWSIFIFYFLIYILCSKSSYFRICKMFIRTRSKKCR